MPRDDSLLPTGATCVSRYSISKGSISASGNNSVAQAVSTSGTTIYVADSESNGVAPHPGWKRGIRIGNLKDGKVLYRIPDPLEMKGTSAAEGLAVDAKGNVYGGEVGPRQLVKHVKQ
jgi:sugar lactone lactonase YvrE